jgi:formiminoglutamate deiminase
VLAETVGATAAAGTYRHAVVGAAIHSVRAVPPDQLRRVAVWAFQRRAPLHVHLSEQPAENDACRAAYGVSPTRLLVDSGVLRPRGRGLAVHATHLDDEDVALLGATMTGVCACPTTERDLADGLGRMRDLTKAGSPLCLGSDQHAVIDLFEEARGLELGERLRTGRRGHWTAGELLGTATWNGHAALGWPAGGRIEPGALADLVTVGLDSVRLAGATAERAAESVVYAATAADVRHVVVSGREIVRDGRHLLVEDVPAALAEAIAAVAGD